MAKIKLMMEVDYDLNGVSPDDLASWLKDAAQRAVGEGMLTGSTEAEVVSYSIATQIAPANAPTEEQIASFMQERMMSGDLTLAEIPTRLARYGVMDPVDFAAEMEERIGDMADYVPAEPVVAPKRRSSSPGFGM